MTDNEFWSLIDVSREMANGKPQQQERVLRLLLRKQTPDDVVEFRRRKGDADSPNDK